MANVKNGYNVIMQLELGCGDMVLLHPWLARTFAPNLSASSANLLIIHIGDSASKRQGSRLSTISIFTWLMSQSLFPLVCKIVQMVTHLQWTSIFEWCG